MDEMKWHTVYISVNDPDDHALIDEIILSLKNNIAEMYGESWADSIPI